MTRLSGRTARTLAAVVSAAALLFSCAASLAAGDRGAPALRSAPTLADRLEHLDRVRRADFCAKCHPEATAEHRMNTHGRAFSDKEVRLATARFSIDGCIACHTPRPVFETGIGMNPLKRLHHLEEANDCLSCHARESYDYSAFQGGKEDCAAAFDGRVGMVEACASCHRNHGTPYQWEHAKFGKQAGNQCVDCHMPEVVRPIAVGGEPKKTRRHTFYGARSESQVGAAYGYDVRLDGNEVVVKVSNEGAGHNIPTELKQRSIESLVIVRDVTGREVGRSRQVFRDPYKRPYGLHLPVNTQIPSGESREHRVPISTPVGTIETTLFFKLYYPIEDTHPDLTRVLESRSMAFGPIEPSTKPIDSAPEVHARLPEAIPVEAASPANLADFPHPKIAAVPLDVPDGSKEGDIEKLVSLFQYPVPQANRQAQDALVKIGERAVPALMTALGSWDNKTWMQAQGVLARMGAKALPAVVAALDDGQLYTRFHAREVLPRFGDLGAQRATAIAHLTKYLTVKNAVDRYSSAEALGRIGAKDAAPALRALLEDLDYDACAAAARALAMLGDRPSAPAIRAALDLRRKTVETARDLAWSLAALGDPAGVRALMDGLDYPDDLVRESIFEAYFDVTGASHGYAPNLPFEERTAALAELRAWWADVERDPARVASAMRKPRSLQTTAAQKAEIAKHLRDVGGNDMAPADAKKTQEAMAKLREIGPAAVPQIMEGLKWPAGFAEKRVGYIQLLMEMRDPDAVPALLEATSDPVVSVALWACAALEALGDPEATPWVKRVLQRVETLAPAGKLPPNVGHPEDVRANLGRALQALGDSEGTRLLLRLLYSGEATARASAEAALTARFATPSAHEPPIAKEVREELAQLSEKRAAIVTEMRRVWEKLQEEAEAAAATVKTRTEAFAALTKFDFAEEAGTRYARLDPRAFGVDFRRTTVAADAVGSVIYEDRAYRDALPARDLHSIVERQGWAVPATGMTSTISTESIELETAADGPGGGVSFGIGGPGGLTVPVEWWRDYEISFEVEIVKSGFWILDRYDPIWAIFAETCLTQQPATRAGVLNPTVQEGKRYEMVHSVEGSTVVHRQRELAAGTAPGEWTELQASTPQNVRKGGMVFQLDPGSKVILRNLKLRVIRTDAAEAYNTVIATRGR
ncbi:MAG: HEAT repeat domain-containing protein [Planctomycetes bacterium]|nr:HEAT repeat domain-containing protein [Planctomycetota bacterium]